MIKRMKDWVYAVKVCRKYGIQWEWLTTSSGCYWFGCDKIEVNPFVSEFLSTFMHEVGHHVDHKKKNYHTYFQTAGLRFTPNERCIYKSLDAEGSASRFAVKSKKANKEYLLKMFNTYSSEVFRRMDKEIVVNEFSNIVDCVYRNIRRIEK